MSIVLLLSFSYSLVSLSIMMIQPMSLGFMVMCIGIASSALVSFISYPWYGFMLFLVYIGGLLVMFMYIISLIPNLIFLSMKIFFFFFLYMTGIFLAVFFSVYNYVDLGLMEFVYMNMNNLSMGNSGLVLMNYNFFCYILLGVLLLLVLISVVKICYYCEGPLRVFKYKYA
uniref:NADH dehydrogenase subunit 6 n=1 Tax=Cirroteuthis muelleri TaxID=202430 RepID=A0A9E9JM75_9MOLL|nr:NADH dehydrogenase subunit 6 [Cirroteuthis muelleri]WAP91420.1 NADH dehydrogenase subunit 6 [Cirroteuthis muelleri]